MNGTEKRNNWRRLHPLSPILRSLQFVFLLIAAGLFASLGRETALLVMLGLAAAGVVGNTLTYFFFRYSVTDDSLVITHGVLFRKRRIIPRSRIQNVDMRAGILHQLLGVVSARIETAGGGGSEASLNVVSRDEATLLRQTLVAGAALEAPPSPGEEEEATPERPTFERPTTTPPAFLRRVTLLDLAIAGATSNRAGVLVGALLGGDYLFQFVPTERLLGRFLPPEALQAEAAVESLVTAWQHNLGAFLTGLAVLSIFFGIAGWAISVLASAIRYFDFTLKARESELQISYGLLTRQEKGLRLSRVQNIQIEESILRRRFKLATLRVQTAGYGPGIEESERVETLTPIARWHEIPDYLKIVLPEFDWTEVEWRRSHPRARRRLFIRRAAVVVLVSGVLALVLTPTALWLLLGLVPAWIFASLHYHHLGHAEQGSFVLTREGLWNRRTYIVPLRKIQTLQLRQTPIQRRLDLATLTVETAGSPYDWHAARSIDLGTAYGRELMEGWAAEVTRTGLTF